MKYEFTTLPTFIFPLLSSSWFSMVYHLRLFFCAYILQLSIQKTAAISLIFSWWYQKTGSQRPSLFGKFGGAINTIYLFGCLRGRGGLKSSQKSKMAFSSPPKLLATLMGPIASLRTWSSRTVNNFYRSIRETILNNNRAQFLDNKMWKTQTPKLKKILWNRIF